MAKKRAGFACPSETEWRQGTRLCQPGTKFNKITKFDFDLSGRMFS